MTKRLLSLAVLALLLLTFAGGSFAQEPTSGGTLRAAFQSEWESLDPHVASSVSTFQILNNVLDTLTFLDDDIRVIPWLAESWEQSEDELTWTFSLRQDAVFSNGEPMTAEHVKFTFDRLKDPEIGSGNAFRVGGADAEITVVDDYTISITTADPVSILPALLAANKSTGIMHPDSVEDNGIVRTPIGTGPFQISEVEGTTRVLLTRNENFWQEGLPYLDAVEILPIPDDTAREVSLTQGEVDWVQAIAPQNFEALDANPDVIVGTAPQLAYDYFGLNLTKEPFSDVRVRQAMAKAIDREVICQFAYFGLCNPIQGPTGPGSPWFIDYTPYDQDIEGAKALLAEAGYPDGFEMSMMATSDFSETVRASQVLEQQLQAIGIEMEIEQLEFSEWLDRQAAGEFDAFMLSWIGLTDGNDYFYLQHRTDQVFNFTGFSDETFDALVDEARTIGEFDARYALYEEANKILVDAAPYIYMYNKQFVQAHRSNVEGYVVRSDSAVNFWGVWLSE